MSETRMDAEERNPALTSDQPPTIVGRRPGQLPSGRHGLPREFVVRNQQTRIVAALAKVVARHGYAATSVRAILEESGVSRATFYRHYESKQDCFNKAFAAIADGLVRRVEEAYRTEGEWPARVSRALYRFLEALAREPDMARMCMVESLAAGPEALAIYRSTSARFQAFLDEAGERAPHREQLPAVLSRALISGIVGIVYDELVSGRAKTLIDLHEDLLYFALAPYLGRGGAVEAVAAHAGARD